MKTSVSGAKSAAKSSLKRPTGHLQYRQAEMRPTTPGKKSARLIKSVKSESILDEADWSQASFSDRVNLCLHYIQKKINVKKD